MRGVRRLVQAARRRAIAARVLVVVCWVLAGARPALSALGAGPSAPPQFSGQPGVAEQRGQVVLGSLPQIGPGGSAPLAGSAALGEGVEPSALDGGEQPLPAEPPGPAGVYAAAPESLAGLITAPTAATRSPALAASFLALEDNNLVIPPDTHGAAGPNHLMITLNGQVRVQDRAGQPLLTVGLSSFWGPVSGGSGTFDPRVTYDPYGQRWIAVACDEKRSSGSALLVGVSQTSDPTGPWNLYRIDADLDNLAWADFPSLGFNGAWITVQVNLYNVATPDFSRSVVLALDKADLYAGGPGRYTRFDLPGIGATQVPAVTYDPAEPRQHFVQNWNGNSGGQGWLRLYAVSGPVGQETFSLGPFVASPEPWTTVLSPSAQIAPQLGSDHKIQVNDGRIRSAFFRHGSVWAAHTVMLPASGATRSAAQWWQITPAGNVVQRGRVDDPSGLNFYAFPSLAVNAHGDVLVGYSCFSALTYASACYSFRAAGDPAGTLRPPVTFKAGEAPYYKTFGTGSNRWGDYSATVVDPVDDTSFWTIQEYAALPAGGADRWGTWWGRVTVADLPPSLAPLPDQYLNDDGSSVTLPLTVADADTPLDQLALDVAASDPNLFPSGSLVLSAGSPPALALAPAPGLTGTARITVTVSDSASQASQSFTAFVGPLANLSLTVTDGQVTALPGTAITYTLVVANHGPRDVTDASLTNLLPASVAHSTWRCATAVGTVCAAAGSGSLVDVAVSLPPGGVVTYTVSGIVTATLGSLVVNTATVRPPPNRLDHPADSSASDSTRIGNWLYMPLVAGRVQP